MPNPDLTIATVYNQSNANRRTEEDATLTRLCSNAFLVGSVYSSERTLP
jgi:hypothetical protein